MEVYQNYCGTTGMSWYENTGFNDGFYFMYKHAQEKQGLLYHYDTKINEFWFL